MATLTLALAVAATVLDGVLAGASLDQSIKQLPARSRIGAVAFSVYSRAADLGNGILWYAVLGIGAALTTIAAAAASLLAANPFAQALPLLIAALPSVLHSLATARAAPTNFSQRGVASDEAALTAVFDRFESLRSLRSLRSLADPLRGAASAHLRRHARGAGRCRTLTPHPGPCLRPRSRRTGGRPMSLRRVVALAIRIVRQFLRDRRSLALLFVAPLLVMTLLNFVLNNSTSAVTLGIVLPDGQASTAILDQISFGISRRLAMSTSSRSPATR